MGKYIGMFPIPEKASKREKPMRNKRITEYVKCDICGKQATETHEWFFDGSKTSRNFCIKNNWQYKLCKYHHEKFHHDAKFNKRHQEARRKEIMAEKGWFTIEQWIANTPFIKAHTERNDEDETN